MRPQCVAPQSSGDFLCFIAYRNGSYADHLAIGVGRKLRCTLSDMAWA
ncbi:hypothetical protein KL86DES1_20029 [uncultured Desulfovibrio sp.]|uniref:Uncharacterized protein n=1 Tax=uncultured Desulfovibrio sp. TaxID=167968 RepID=A0A212L1Z2_9BACT|nr:hypothetical protein KL86DES1_20029 [uncultured Desulfovibrio sp.]VZH32929.1 conserved protein of unknown function [Desulfovibrio sp. 86]